MADELLGKLLLQTAYLEGDFVLRSGKRSKYYLDKYLFETDPQVLRGIVHEMAMMVRERLAVGEEYHRLAAPELGGVVLGAGLSLELGLPLLLVRKLSKDYGTAKRIEGRFQPGERVALVEDIVTSGGRGPDGRRGSARGRPGGRRPLLRGGQGGGRGRSGPRGGPGTAAVVHLQRVGYRRFSSMSVYRRESAGKRLVCDCACC